MTPCSGVVQFIVLAATHDGAIRREVTAKLNVSSGGVDCFLRVRAAAGSAGPPSR